MRVESRKPEARGEVLAVVVAVEATFVFNWVAVAVLAAAAEFVVFKEAVAFECGNIRAKLPRRLCSSIVSTRIRKSSGVITSRIVLMLG